MRGPDYEQLNDPVGARLRAQARAYADSPVDLTHLLAGAKLSEAYQFEGEAWAFREAIAIRIVDHPNEATGKEDDVGS